MMNKDELLKIQNQINSLNLPEFNGINIGKALTYNILGFEPKNILYELKAIIAPFIKFRYKIIKNQGNIVFLWGSSTAKRKDHEIKFDNIANTVTDSTIIKDDCSQSFIINPFLIFKLLKFLFICRKLSVKKIFARNIAYWLFFSYCQLEQFKSLYENYLKNKKLICVWCDVLPSDYIAVEFFKSKGIKTVTLQHAEFNPGLLEGNLAYTNSLSDYFICFGKHASKLAQTAGLTSDKLLEFGNPEFVGKKLPQKMDSKKTGFFGLSLSYIDFKEENINLLKIASLISEFTGLKCFIRQHPSLNMPDYSEFINNKDFEFKDKKESMDKFIERIEFVVLGLSNVYISMIMKLIPVFRMQLPNSSDQYSDINFSTFSDIEVFKELYTKFKNEPSFMEKNMIGARVYLNSDDSLRKYREFFEKFK